MSCLRGKAGISQASWTAGLNPGYRVILPAGRAFEYDVETPDTECFICDFRVAASYPHRDPLTLIGLPVSVPSSDLPGEIARCKTTADLLRQKKHLHARPLLDMCLVGFLSDGFAEGTLSPRPVLPMADWLLAAKNFLVLHFKEAITLASLAAHIGVSPAHLAHEFRRAFGITPIEFLYAERLWHAARFLALEREADVGEVGTRCGFVNQSHFTRRFRARYKMTPTQWRNKSIDTSPDRK